MVSSGLLVFFDGCGLAVCPCGVVVVEAVVLEAAVEDADEPVGEGAEGLVMEVAVGAVLVVERAASWALGKRAERCLIECVVEPPVADVSGENRPFLAGGDRQW